MPSLNVALPRRSKTRFLGADRLIRIRLWLAMLGLAVLPMVGVVFAPTRSGSIYMNAGQAFAPPSPRATGEPKPEDCEWCALQDRG